MSGITRDVQGGSFEEPKKFYKEMSSGSGSCIKSGQ